MDTAFDCVNMDSDTHIYPKYSKIMIRYALSRVLMELSTGSMEQCSFRKKSKKREIERERERLERERQKGERETRER